ncbi:MAG: VanZ family protein [Chitinophagaceae bacterium]|nr:MAG: VanZ family protein [Chitinophagaceae bacterium]
MKLNPVTKKVLFAVVLVVATILLSVLPEAKIENITHTSYNYYTDLAQHSSWYLALTMLTCWIFPEYAPWKIGLILFGLSLGLEIGQHFFPKRSFSIHDIFANFSGTALGSLLVTVFRARRRRTAVSGS